MARNIPHNDEAAVDTAALADQVAKSTRRKEPERTVRKYKTEELAPTGSTLLNLACSENPYGGYLLGGIETIPGASSSGKTVLALTSLAEAALLPRFDDYKLIHDDAEERRAFDLKYLFGPQTAERIVEPPNGNSPGIQHFQANILGLIKKEQPFIYVLDSFDSLSSDEELEKEMRKALAMAKSEEAAKKIAGSYGTEKAKIAGQVLRMVNNQLKATGSLLIIIQQLRQKLNAQPFSDPWTTAGGEAPFFYSNHQIRMAKTGDIKRGGLVVGTKSLAKLKKNSVTGKLREAEFEIYTDYGIDDIMSCIDFLIKEEWWKKKGHSIIAEDLGLELKKAELVAAIEEDGLHDELIKATGRCWRERERSVKTQRQPRYA